MKKVKCFTKHGSHKPLHFRVHTSNSVQTHRLDTWENTGKNIFTGMREKKKPYHVHTVRVDKVFFIIQLGSKNHRKPSQYFV